MMDEKIRRSIIMDHYEYPRHKKTVKASYFKILRQQSKTCMDDITISIKFKDNIIERIYFDGNGCAVSLAASSILCEMAKGQDVNYVLKLIDNYENMLYEKEYDFDFLGELMAFELMHKQPNRIKCGLVAASAIKELINNHVRDQK